MKYLALLFGLSIAFLIIGVVSFMIPEPWGPILVNQGFLIIIYIYMWNEAKHVGNFFAKYQDTTISPLEM